MSEFSERIERITANIKISEPNVDFEDASGKLSEPVINSDTATVTAALDDELGRGVARSTVPSGTGFCEITHFTAMQNLKPTEVFGQRGASCCGGETLEQELELVEFDLERVIASLREGQPAIPVGCYFPLG